MNGAYTTASALDSPTWTSLNAAVLAGTIAAVVEMIPVLGIQNGVLGVSPTRVFQAIASGLLGIAAYQGGAATMITGIVVHWLISIGAALVFAWASTRWRDLIDHPALAGVGFGVLAFAVMTSLVVPLSAAAFPPNRDSALILVSLAVHMLFFGLPIGLATRWRFRLAGLKG